MPKIYFIACLLFLTSFSFSQKTVNLKGKIIEKKTKLPIESATVYLSLAKDSTVIDYTITNKLGNFSFNIKKVDKPVFLKVSFVTFQDFKTALPSIQDDKDFGTINLEESINTLNEIVIKNDAPPIRIKKDTLEFNASSFKVRPDANVETLLKQLPGVEIDAEGKITVNGKEVKQVLVNGKPFFDKDGKIALQNLPSDIINKVQVSDLKTKKEELTGEKAKSNDASINLTIDENKNKGFFGKIMSGLGSDERYESSLLLNYFKNKRKISFLGGANNINSVGFSLNEVFDSMGSSRNTYISSDDDGSFNINGLQFGGGNGITKSYVIGTNYADQLVKDFDTNASYFLTNSNTKNSNRTNLINLLPSGNFTTKSQSETENKTNANNFNVTFEYKIDSTTTFYYQPKFVKSDSKRFEKSTEVSTDNFNQIVNEKQALDQNETDNFTFSNYFTFNKVFKRKGRNINLSITSDNSKNNLTNTAQSKTTFNQDTNNDGIPDITTFDNRNQKRFNKNKNDEYSLEVDYNEPLKDSLQIVLSLDYKKVKIENNQNTFDFSTSSNDFSLLNNLLTSELSSNRNTINPNFGINSNKSNFYFGVFLGTAITDLKYKSNYLNVGNEISKKYLLPSVEAYVDITFSKSKSLYFNYDYKVEFPQADQILSVTNLSDALNTFVGNSNLIPEKSHQIYLSFNNYDFQTKSGMYFWSSFNFNESNIVASTTFDSSRKRNTTYVNVDNTFNSSFGFNINKTIKKEANSYKFGSGMNISLSKNKGFSENELFISNRISVSPRVNFTYNYGELLTINPSYSFTYSENKYTNYLIEKATNVTHKLNLETTSYFPKHFVFGNDFGYNFNSNIADGFKKDFYLWNISLGYNFFKDKLLAKIKVYDVLNQNQNTKTTISATSILDEQNTVLKRYVMFSLTYKLQKFGGKEKK